MQGHCISWSGRNSTCNLQRWDDFMKLELEVFYGSHLKQICKDVCNELATNFFLHDAIKILPKLPVFESIAFSVSAKFWVYFWFYLPRMLHHRGLFSIKASKNLFAYSRGLREGDTRNTSFLGPTCSCWEPGGWKYSTSNFSAITPKITSVNQLLV